MERKYDSQDGSYTDEAIKLDDQYKLDYFEICFGDGFWVHANDLNSSACPKISEDGTSIMDPNEPQQTLNRYNLDGETPATDFRCKNSYQTSNVYLCKYKLVYIEKYKSYYIGFDFAVLKTDNDNKIIEYLEPDGVYSNYILKMSPGYVTRAKQTEAEKKRRRVMCEDLGTTDDFDFNDLVFDVYYTENEEAAPYRYTAHIEIQAAGGTMPIYIGSEVNEAHELLGQHSSTGTYSAMIHPTPKKSITLQTNSTNPDDIDIIVQNVKAGKTITLPQTSAAYDPTSSAPQKICVPTTVEWTNEHQQIENKYPDFRKWVQDEDNNLNWWGGQENSWGDMLNE